jgi:hypothetical protein
VRTCIELILITNEIALRNETVVDTFKQADEIKSNPKDPKTVEKEIADLFTKLQELEDKRAKMKDNLNVEESKALLTTKPLTSIPIVTSTTVKPKHIVAKPVTINPTHTPTPTPTPTANVTTAVTQPTANVTTSSPKNSTITTIAAQSTPTATPSTTKIVATTVKITATPTPTPTLAHLTIAEEQVKQKQNSKPDNQAVPVAAKTPPAPSSLQPKPPVVAAPNPQTTKPAESKSYAFMIVIITVTVVVLLVILFVFMQKRRNARKDRVKYEPISTTEDIELRHANEPIEVEI